MAKHEQAVGKSDEWYTPPYVFEALGCEFDYDVASPGRKVTPWIPARNFITKYDDNPVWSGFIWLNPPFGGRNAIRPWLDKFFRHGNGICLTPDRTSAPWWCEFAQYASIVLFVSPKIMFISGDGAKNNSPAQGTCLFGVGKNAAIPLVRAQSYGLGRAMSPLPQTFRM